jgi:predicted flap endonuclease-1-like 5' DNA nuclease
MKIEDVEGIGPLYAQQLAGIGIPTAEGLLEQGASPGGREAIGKALQIDPSVVLAWVNRCDLMRVPGVGSEYSDLLEMAGVDSVPELAQRNPANLAQAFADAVAARPDLVRRVPSEDTVRGWVDAAKGMPRTVEH